MVDTTEELKQNLFVKIKNNHKNTVKFLGENKPERNVLVKALAIAFAISLFFSIPFLFILMNIGMFGMIFIAITGLIGVFVFMVTFCFVYYDVVKHYDERYKEHKFNTYIFVQASTVVLLVILMTFIMEVLF